MAGEELVGLCPTGFPDAEIVVRVSGAHDDHVEQSVLDALAEPESDRFVIFLASVKVACPGKGDVRRGRFLKIFQNVEGYADVNRRRIRDL